MWLRGTRQQARSAIAVFAAFPTARRGMTMRRSRSSKHAIITTRKRRWLALSIYQQSHVESHAPTSRRGVAEARCDVYTAAAYPRGRPTASSYKNLVPFAHLDPVDGLAKCVLGVGGCSASSYVGGLYAIKGLRTMRSAGKHPRFVCAILAFLREAMIRASRETIRGWCESAVCA